MLGTKQYVFCVLDRNLKEGYVADQTRCDQASSFIDPLAQSYIDESATNKGSHQAGSNPEGQMLQVPPMHENCSRAAQLPQTTIPSVCIWFIMRTRASTPRTSKATISDIFDLAHPVLTDAIRSLLGDRGPIIARRMSGSDRHGSTSTTQ